MTEDASSPSAVEAEVEANTESRPTKSEQQKLPSVVVTLPDRMGSLLELLKLLGSASLAVIAAFVALLAYIETRKASTPKRT